MCYAIPGKVIKIEKNIALIQYFNEIKKAITEIPNLKINDYVYAQGGFVIEKLPPKTAKEILSTWEELFYELQEKDEKLSPSLKINTKNQELNKILNKSVFGKILNEKEVSFLFNLNNKQELSTVYKTANYLRHKNLGNSCCIHGIIEISNICDQNCYYCGIRKHNKTIKRYKLNLTEILELVDYAVNKYNFKAIVLQSGENSYTLTELKEIIASIKKQFNVLIFISFGEIGKKGLQELYQAGARGLLMRFETANPTLYEKLHPESTLDTRIKELESAYKLGYLIITGSLIGIPGQTNMDIMNDLFLAKKLHTEMFSFGPFIPHPTTPLKNFQKPNKELIIKTLAIARLMAETETKILITTGFETLSKTARKKGLLVGANSLMLNITPNNYKKLYHIYPKRAHGNEDLDSQITSTIQLLQDLGRAPTDLSISS